MDARMNTVSGTVKFWYTLRTSTSLNTTTNTSASTEVYKLSIRNESQDQISDNTTLNIISPNSTIDLREKDTGKKITFHKSNWQWFLMIFISCNIILIIFTNVVLLTCQTTNQSCYPQFNFQITNTSPESNSIVNALNDVVHVFTFLAKEYNENLQPKDSIANLGNFTQKYTINMESNSSLANPLVLQRISEFPETVGGGPDINDIQTFATGNSFDLGYTGYCRYDVTYGRFCSGGIINGIDLVATLIRDFGLQLSEITLQDNSKNISEALVLGYEVSLPNISKYLKKKSSLNLNSALVIKNISKILPIILTIQLLLNWFIFFQGFLQFIKWGSKKYCDNKQIKLVNYFSANNLFLKRTFLVLTIFIFIINFSNLLISIVYIGKLKTIVKEISLANVTYEKGFKLMIGSTIVSGVQFIISTIYFITK